MILNFVGLSKEGYDNEYYAAAVKSMSLSWHNFFFVAFDPGGFVTIDKPPLGFWFQVASVKLFGFLLKLRDLLADTDSAAYQAYLDQFSAWNNNQPTGDWELSAYIGTMFGMRRWLPLEGNGGGLPGATTEFVVRRADGTEELAEVNSSSRMMLTGARGARASSAPVELISSVGETVWEPAGSKLRMACGSFISVTWKSSRLRSVMTLPLGSVTTRSRMTMRAVRVML